MDPMPGLTQISLSTINYILSTKNAVSRYINEKTPKFNQGLFRELEFKVFARTVTNELKWFFWIFGCFSDIG